MPNASALFLNNLRVQDLAFRVESSTHIGNLFPGTLMPRRLPSTFVSSFDQWLQRGVYAQTTRCGCVRSDESRVPSGTGKVAEAR